MVTNQVKIVTCTKIQHHISRSWDGTFHLLAPNLGYITVLTGTCPMKELGLLLALGPSDTCKSVFMFIWLIGLKSDTAGLPVSCPYSLLSSSVSVFFLFAVVFFFKLMCSWVSSSLLFCMWMDKAVLRRATSFTSSTDTVLLLACLANASRSFANISHCLNVVSAIAAIACRLNGLRWSSPIFWQRRSTV